jgi:hypothetical protein
MIAGMSAGGPYVINLNSGGYYVYCRAHTVAAGLKREEAEALVKALNADAGAPSQQPPSPVHAWAKSILDEFSDHEDDIIVTSYGDAIVTFGDLRQLLSK